jgi:hypothetical protein
MLVQKGIELTLFTDYDDPAQRLIGIRSSDGTRTCDFTIDTTKDAIEKVGTTLADYKESYEEQLVFDLSAKGKSGGQWLFRRIHYTVSIVTTKPYKMARMIFNAKYSLLGVPTGQVGCDFEISSMTLRDWGLQIVEWARILPMPRLTLIEKPRL